MREFLTLLLLNSCTMMAKMNSKLPFTVKLPNLCSNSSFDQLAIEIDQSKEESTQIRSIGIKLAAFIEQVTKFITDMNELKEIMVKFTNLKSEVKKANSNIQQLIQDPKSKVSFSNAGLHQIQKYDCEKLPGWGSLTNFIKVFAPDLDQESQFEYTYDPKTASLVLKVPGMYYNTVKAIVRGKKIVSLNSILTPLQGDYSKGCITPFNHMHISTNRVLSFFGLGNGKTLTEDEKEFIFNTLLVKLYDYEDWSEYGVWCQLQ